jgi:casein kinase II subunit beta
MSESDSYSS